MKSYEEMSEEEIRAFGEKLKREQEERIIFNKRCDEITEMYNEGNLTELDVFWHTDKKDIDFTLQREQLDFELLENGYTLIESVDMEKILDSMQDGNPQLYREKQLFHDDWNDWKICGVIDYWLRKEKLIPPSIIWNDMLNKTYVAEGKHRFNVAYYYGEKTIPIIIPNKHYDQVNKLIFG